MLIARLLAPSVLTLSVAATLAAASAPSRVAPSLATRSNASTAPAVPDWLSDKKRLEAELVEGLRELADWCRLKGMQATRIQLQQRILELVPEDEDALKALGWKKRGGEWVEPKKPATGKDKKKASLLEDLAERRAAIAAPYAKGIRGILEANPELPRTKRDALLSDVLGVDPTSEWARLERGEGRYGDAWVLLETLNGKRRRRQLSEACFAAWESATELRSSAIPGNEQSWGVDFQHCVQTRDVRVVTTGERVEAERVARMVHASERFFSDLVAAPDAQLPEELTIYLLTRGTPERDAFLANYPGLSAKRREFLRGLIGAGLEGGNDAVHWPENVAQRLDVSVRHGFSQLLSQTFGISPELGWVWEGFGLYLTRHLIGTRLVWYVRQTEYKLDDGIDLAEKMFNPDANWMQMAYDMLRGSDPPKLAFVLGRDLNSMGTEDLLAAYVFVAYLVEGHPEHVRTVLERVGDGQNSVQVFEEVVGLPIPLVQERLLRWLEERV